MSFSKQNHSAVKTILESFLREKGLLCVLFLHIIHDKLILHMQLF